MIVQKREKRYKDIIIPILKEYYKFLLPFNFQEEHDKHYLFCAFAIEWASSKMNFLELLLKMINI